MFGIQDLPLFVIAGVLLNITPGPDSLLVMTRSATQGWRAGSAATFGICAGTLVHIFAAALGLSALLSTSSLAFAVVKYLGAAYLVYVGLTMMFARQRPALRAATDGAVHLPHQRIFLQGFLTNALNPKVALFFLAFMPQFIDPQSADKAAAFVVLGVIFNITNAIWCHILALTTAFASHRLRASERVAQWLNRAIGAMFLSFGLRLALSNRS